MAATLLGVVGSVLGCGGGGGGAETDGNNSPCPAGDVDCFLDAMLLTGAGNSIALRTIDAALLTSTPEAAGPPAIWSVVPGGNGIDGWDGAQWTNTDASGDLTLAVWTGSATDAWAVGYSQRIKHWDGASWTTMSVGATTLPAYNAVWGSGPSDVYAGGSDGTLVRWNGEVWTPVDAGISVDIGAISGSGSGDVWVGGIAGALRHWNGATWSPVAANASIDITSIWVGGASEAWATGTNTNVAIHWNGLSWSPTTLPGATYVHAVWGSSASDVWAVAYEITQGTFLLHWNGSAWSTRPDPPGMVEFAGLWGRSATDLWLGGNANMGHWNGVGWSVVPASGGLHRSIHGLVQGAVAGFPPSIINQPPSMTFNGPKTTADLTLDWTDDNGCTPAFCMQVCSPSVRCSAKARCTPLLNDGLLAGSTKRTVGYSVAPASPPETLELRIIPVSSADCSDPIAGLVAGNPQVRLGGPAVIEQTLNAEPTTTTTNGSHDGTWNLSVSIDTCYVFTHTVPITITRGAFSGHLFQYCADPVGGATQLSTGSCGAGLSEDVSISLTVDGNDIDGNLTLAGGGCNGTNGFSGRFSSSTVGQAASFFGQLDFTK